MYHNEKDWLISLVNQLKNYVEKPFHIVLSPARYCEKVKFSTISRAGEREREDKPVSG